MSKTTKRKSTSRKYSGKTSSSKVSATPRSDRPCIYCQSKDTIKFGRRHNQSGIVQLYRCNHCYRKFRERTAHNATYPIHAIIETLSLYNRGYTLAESSRRASRHHRVTISKQVAATWRKRYASLFPYLRIRNAIAAEYSPHALITSTRLHHGQVYDYGYHHGKIAQALADTRRSRTRPKPHWPRALARLRAFLEQAPTETPHDLFRKQQARASQTKSRFSLDEVAITERDNIAVEMASFVIPTVSRNTKRHETLQNFMLANDLATVAVEVPVYLSFKDLEHYRAKLNFAVPFTLDRDATITGHIDILQVRNRLIYILDYKPGAKKDKPIEQLMVYALALARHTGLRLLSFRCAWFDDEHYYEFQPLHVVHKLRS